MRVDSNATRREVDQELLENVALSIVAILLFILSSACAIAVHCILGFLVPASFLLLVFIVGQHQRWLRTYTLLFLLAIGQYIAYALFGWLMWASVMQYPHGIPWSDLWKANYALGRDLFCFLFGWTFSKMSVSVVNGFRELTTDVRRFSSSTLGSGLAYEPINDNDKEDDSSTTTTTTPITPSTTVL